MHGNVTYIGEWSVKTIQKDGTWYAQVWLTDAMFSIMKQGRFDPYSYTLKFVNKDDREALGDKLIKAIEQVVIRTCKPERKDFRRKEVV
jgi:hypothetical protein